MGPIFGPPGWVLSRVCSHAVDPLAKLASNPCEGIKHIYSGPRSDIIWSDADIVQMKASCSSEIGHVIDLAAHTGLRLSDLIRLSWSHVGENAIVVTTAKSRHRREAIIPLYGEPEALLSRIPKRSAAILTSSHKRPWTANGLGSSINSAKAGAGLSGRDLHFHDLRGTVATRFYTAGLSGREIAEIMGWEEDQVAQIIRRYVSRTAALKERIRKLEQVKK